MDFCGFCDKLSSSNKSITSMLSLSAEIFVLEGREPLSGIFFINEADDPNEGTTNGVLSMASRSFSSLVKDDSWYSENWNPSESESFWGGVPDEFAEPTTKGREVVTLVS